MRDRVDHGLANRVQRQLRALLAAHGPGDDVVHVDLGLDPRHRVVDHGAHVAVEAASVDDVRLVGAPEQPERDANRREQEGELADVAETDAGGEGGGEPAAGRQYSRGGEHRLDHQGRHAQPDHEQGASQQDRRVQQQSDRAEEHAGEERAKGQHVGQGLHPVLRLREDEPRQKRPDRQRKARGVGDERGAQAEEPDAQGEEFPVLEQHDPVEHPGGQQTPGEDQHRDDHQTANQSADGGRGGIALKARHQRQQQHERQDGEVLEDQQADRGLTVRCFEFLPVGDGLGDDRRGRHRAERAVEEGVGRRYPERDGGEGHDEDRPAHLDPAAHEHHAGPVPHLGERQFETDREQQQGDAEFRQRLDVLGNRDQPEAGGSDEHPGQHESQQRRSVHAVRERHDRDGEAHQQGQVAEESQFHHGAPPRSGAGSDSGRSRATARR